MELLNEGLAMLTVGYILGVWTSCAIFREWQGRDDDRTPAQRSVISMRSVASNRTAAPALPIPDVIWISGPRR